MDSKRFELTMENFFNKAGVKLFRKDSDYQAGDNAVPYILLDSKRKTCYLAETDVPAAGLDDMELTAVASWLSEKNSLPEAVTRAALSLGRAVGSFPADFVLPGEDTTGFARKSALIISEENADKTKSYLDGTGFIYQSVPFKGAFLVIFLDKSASERMSQIYDTSSKEYMESVSGGAEPDGQSISFDDLLKDVPPLDDENDAAETVEKPAEQTESIFFDELVRDAHASEEEENVAAEPQADGLEVKDDEEKLLDDLDLSFMQKESGLEFSEEEGDLLYSKIINEQAEKIKDAPSPKARGVRDMPKDVIDSLEDSGEEIVEEANNRPAPEKKTSGASIGSAVSARPASMASRIAANLLGFIFFAPAYVIGKITKRVLPPFVIYWLAAIVVIFGAYQAALSVLAPMFYPQLAGLAAEAAANLGSLLPVDPDADPVRNAAAGMLLSSAVFFYGQAAALPAAENGLLLRYLMSFGAFLMIFPRSRSFGARITVFSVLLFFAAPLILGTEAYVLSSIADGAAQGIPTQEAASILASGAAFTVFVVPVILLIALFWISGYFIPHKNVEVLP